MEEGEEQNWGRFEDDVNHRHYDGTASEMEPGTCVKCQTHAKVCAWARRRRNRDLCVPREPPLEPSGVDKKKFYEMRLLQGLPWHCPRKPRKEYVDDKVHASWFFKTTAAHVPEKLREFSMNGRQLDEPGQTFEGMCLEIEKAYTENCNELLCECCRPKTKCV